MSNEQRSLHRVVSLPGAVLLGLGSILGTGVFVSIGVGAGIAGNALLLAIVMASLVAACNALSSAQLAAAHPVSGGTYAYGHRWLTPSLGFTAGWMFVCAKSFSAATAALGFAGYALRVARIDAPEWTRPLAIVGTLVLTALVATGMRRSSRVNAVIVSITLLALGAFCVFGLRDAAGRAEVLWKPSFFGVEGDTRPALVRLLETTALLFVAYAGYARITTMGEEVREPKKTIPRAILATLALSVGIYFVVAFVALGAFGADRLAEAARTSAAPLEAAARWFDGDWLATIVSIGAVTAMLGVLLNLILGLSRVMLAMGRGGDVPRVFGRVGTNGSPNAAVIGVGCAIAALALIGDVKLTWSFSAFTVLVYYAITNLAAIRMPRDERMFPAWIAWAGLIACLSLAFFVEVRVWAIGLGLIGLGFVMRAAVRPVQRSPAA